MIRVLIPGNLSLLVSGTQKSLGAVERKHDNLLDVKKRRARELEERKLLEDLKEAEEECIKKASLSAVHSSMVAFQFVLVGVIAAAVIAVDQDGEAGVIPAIMITAPLFVTIALVFGMVMKARKRASVLKRAEFARERILRDLDKVNSVTGSRWWRR